MNKKLAVLADEIEAALHLDEALAERTIAILAEMSGKVETTAADIDSTDRVLGLIYALKPGWSVSTRGKATMPNGHWRCTLRQSSARDNDEVIGVGRGPTLPHSLLAALLRVLAFKPG